MDFSLLPAPEFLKILKYLPFEERIRIGRVNKTFRQISQLAVSDTKSLDLSEYRFRNLTSDQFAVILELCASNLERIKFGEYDYYQRLATTLAHYEFPRLTHIHLGWAPISQAVLEQLIRNCPNMETLIWYPEFVGFPAITNNRLKKLVLNIRSDAILRTLIGRCPNLEDLDLEMLIYRPMEDYSRPNFISADLLDQVFASCPMLQRIVLNAEAVQSSDSETKLANFWNLPLIYLIVSFDNNLGDDFLRKVATSFPRLQELHLYNLDPTNAGIASLADLQDLQVLKLYFYCTIFEESYSKCDGFDQGIRQLAYCQKLRKFDVKQLNMTGGTLVNFLRSCPQLEYVQVQSITQVDSPEDAVVILDSLAGIPKRDITIHCRIPNYESEYNYFEYIWKSEPVKAAIKKLEEDDGLKITIEKKH